MSQSGPEPTVADLPPYCLGHQSRRDPRVSVSDPFVYHYELWPIGIPRPAHGRTKTAIVCGTCERSYSYTVASRARMRRTGRRKRAAALATIIAVVGCITAVVILALLISPGIFGMLSLTPAAVFLIVVAWGTIKDPWVPGVRLRGDEHHELRPPGSTESYEYERVASEY
jgi:hypothetical protein